MPPSAHGPVGQPEPASSVPPRRGSTLADPYVASQTHLLKPTSKNPLPTVVPPPLAANAGTLGVRHVLCVIGMPGRGKPFISRRLEAYLSFFHGAEVQIFNICEYMEGPVGSDENAEALLADLRDFMGKRNDAAGGNLSCVQAHAENGSGAGSAAVNGCGASAGCGCGAASAARSAAAAAHHATSGIMDEDDHRRKNVDSGKVAIIMSSDSDASFREKWSGTSKERRQWTAATLASDREMGAKLIFIEVIVNKPPLIEANIRAKRAALGLGETTVHELREHTTRVRAYSRMYVTLQDDGSEDDLSYIKIYNYGDKVVTNRMHGYLRMRIAQFLSTVHTTPHVIYLTRHGQSEYNVLGKIGGNPPLSEAGEEYARRLGAWATSEIGSTRARLWTSSLQRTILTAQHIPHPIISPSDPPDEEEHPSMNSTAKRLSEFALSPLAQHGRGEAVDAADAIHISPHEHEPWEQMSPRVYRNLDEIFAGEYEGMRYEDIKSLSPKEATLRSMDKIGYRYPRGESYFDILSRLDPLVHELETYHEPLLIVSHQAVLRMLYAYLMGLPRTKAPKIEIPLHTVMKITYDGWNVPREERFYLGPEGISLTSDGTDGQQNL